MQTFLPYLGAAESAYAHYEECAGLLSMKDLKMQRVHTYHLMRALLVGGTEWDFHPAAMMWEGHEWSLLTYQNAICKEWIHQCGQEDTYLIKTIELYFNNADLSYLSDHQPPAWLYDRQVIISHQSNLIRKDPAYYRKKFPGVPSDLPYIWPV